MKLTFKTFLFDFSIMLVGLLIGNLIFDGWPITIRMVINAAFTATIFALIFRTVVLYGSKKTAEKLMKQIVIELRTGESVVLEAGVSHFKGREAVGGKLVLTNTSRLIFKSHKFNIQNHQEAFALGDIVAASQSKVRSDKPNILTLKFNNEIVEKFVVEDPSLWIETIEQQKKVA